MTYSQIRTRRLQQLAFGGQSPGAPRTSGLVLGIIGTAIFGAFCLLMAANPVASVLEAAG